MNSGGEVNGVVNSLWCGPSPLGLQQRLTIRSFQDHGHRFVLWTYTPDLAVPSGTELRDAREVVGEKEVFRLRGGAHPGSYAIFTDRFMLALLLARGGWWAQMDVTCLRPLDVEASHVFAPHCQTGVSAYVMKAPAASPALWHMLERHPSVGGADNIDWHASMRLMGEGVRAFGMEAFILGREHLDDDRPPWDVYFLPEGGSPPPGRYAHHWCSSVTARHEAVPQQGSFYHRALVRHGVV